MILCKVSLQLLIADLLRRPTLTYAVLSEVDANRPKLTYAEFYAAEVAIKYEGYIKRQLAEVKRREKLDDMKLPEDIDYDAIPGIRIEARQKLKAIRPMNVGAASRISGVSPADISVLLIYLAK